MRGDKKDLLEQLRESLGCGKVTQGAGGRQVRLDIFSVQDAKKLIFLLEKHDFSDPKKEKEFDLWREAVEIIKKNQKKMNAEKGKRGFISTWANFDQGNLKRLFRIREEMKKYKKWKKSDYRWTHSLLARPY